MSLFGKKKEEAVKSGCCCGASCTPEEMKVAEEIKCCGGIKVLGGGCAKCHELESNTKVALEELGVNEDVELITDFALKVACIVGRACFKVNCYPHNLTCLNLNIGCFG